MPEVLIVIDSATHDTTIQMVSALKQAINSHPFPPVVQVMTPEGVGELYGNKEKWRESLICPLTLNVPSWLVFPGQAIFQACRDVLGLRQQLPQWQYLTGTGDLWLPIVLTAKGPLYAEVIGAEVIGTNAESVSQAALSSPVHYSQPVHLPDAKRQPLYELGYRLLRSLSAPPAVYLMQFSFRDHDLCFDRLLPFPIAPAIASLNVQTPDLFTCHWHCIVGNPICDLVIRSTT